eukprot:jgi/Chlat1/7036/Chrsp56S06706
MAQAHDQVDAYAACVLNDNNDNAAVGDGSNAPEEYAKLARYYETKSNFARAAETYERCGNLQAAVRLYLRCGGDHVDKAISLVGSVGDPALVSFVDQGNYRSAHGVLRDCVSALRGTDVSAISANLLDVRRALALLHSYVIVRSLAKIGTE